MIHAQRSSIKWTLEQEAAVWQATDSQGKVVYNGYMWIFGGWHNSFGVPPEMYGTQKTVSIGKN